MGKKSNKYEKMIKKKNIMYAQAAKYYTPNTTHICVQCRYDIVVYYYYYYVRRHASAVLCMYLLARRLSMGTVIIVPRRTVIPCDVVNPMRRRWLAVGGARVNVTAVAAGSRHSCPVSQSVGPERVWPRDCRRSPADFPLGGYNAPPGSRLLTDITCATADQPACHVIATHCRAYRAIAVQRARSRLASCISRTLENYYYYFFVPKFNTYILFILRNL